MVLGITPPVDDPGLLGAEITNGIAHVITQEKCGDSWIPVVRLVADSIAVGPQHPP